MRLEVEMLDIPTIMASLSKIRPVYHSEADFQHAFAWFLHIAYSNINIRLELPWDEGGKQNHLDILAELNGYCFAIELKYKTRGIHLCVGSEEYNLRDQSAQDCGRYDYIKDIVRLEQMRNRYPKYLGYAILLTNDISYWKIPMNNSTEDVNFRLHEGHILQGNLTWRSDTPMGTQRGREDSLVLSQPHNINWHDYSTLSGAGYSRFRYLSVEVPPS